MRAIYRSERAIANPIGRLWSKNGIHLILRNEAYTGTLVWGMDAKDKAEPVQSGEGIPRHRLKGSVPMGEPQAAIPRSQEGASPKGRQHLPP